MLTTIIESIPASPHIETSGEIAINLKRQNKSVNYCWIGSNLPWNDWKLNKLQNFFGGSYDRKLNKFLKILDDNQIKTFKINEIKLVEKSNLLNFLFIFHNQKIFLNLFLDKEFFLNLYLSKFLFTQLAYFTFFNN